jgi:hypothetical protein
VLRAGDGWGNDRIYSHAVPDHRVANPRAHILKRTLCSDYKQDMFEGTDLVGKKIVGRLNYDLATPRAATVLPRDTAICIFPNTCP